MVLRLIGRVVDVTAELARTAVAIGEFVAESAIERVRDKRRNGAPARPAEQSPPRPARPQQAQGQAPVPAERVVAARPAPVPAPEPEPEPLAVVPEPTPGQAARIRQEQRAAEQTEDSPGPEIRVDEPWPGYAKMNAPEIIDRVNTADEAVKAVVLLYERGHRKRKTVLRAAGAD